MSITYYVAKLKCPNCKKLSPKDYSTDISNKIAFEPGIWEAETGEIIEADLDDIEAEYIEISKPKTNKVVCVELWTCPNCHHQNFAELIFLLNTNNVLVEEINSIHLTCSYLDNMQYITDWVNDWAEKFTDRQIFPSLKPSQEEIQKFRDFLEKTKQLTLCRLITTRLSNILNKRLTK